MFDFLRTLVDTVTTLINFLFNSIEALISLILHIPSYTTVVINSLNILPNFVLPFAIAFVSLVTVQYILNRR